MKTLAAVAFLTVSVSGTSVARAEGDVPPPLEEEKVRLDVAADDAAVVIERRTMTVEGWQTTLGIPVFTATEHWVPTCIAPCGVRVPKHGIYRVNGRGIAVSHEFLLPRSPDVRLEVSTRPAAWYSTGVALTLIGALGVAVGGVSTLVAKNITSTGAEESVRQFGIAFLVGGGVMLAAGIPLWLTGKSNARTPDGRSL